MKNLLFYILIVISIIAACNGNKSAKNQTGSDSSGISPSDEANLSDIPVSHSKSTVSIKEIVNSYLQLKNALAGDNSSDAATEGTVLGAAFKNFDKSQLSPEQTKIFEEVEADAMENAEHIGQSNGNIEHQREHFEILSIEMYDLVKTFSSGLVLYKEFCPMYNKGKGGFWLSESKEIHNPYFGKEMLTCGTIKEVLN